MYQPHGLSDSLSMSLPIVYLNPTFTLQITSDVIVYLCAGVLQDDERRCVLCQTYYFYCFQIIYNYSVPR